MRLISINPLTALYIYVCVCVSVLKCVHFHIYLSIYLFVLSGNNWLSSLYIVGYPCCSVCSGDAFTV